MNIEIYVRLRELGVAPIKAASLASEGNSVRNSTPSQSSQEPLYGKKTPEESNALGQKILRERGQQVASCLCQLCAA